MIYKGLTPGNESGRLLRSLSLRTKHETQDVHQHFTDPERPLDHYSNKYSSNIAQATLNSHDEVFMPLGEALIQTHT